MSPEPRARRELLRKGRRLRAGCCFLTGGVGIVVLAGWLFGIAALTAVVPGTVSLKPNTAVGLVLAAIGVGFWTRHRGAQRVVAGVALGLIGFLGLGQLVQDLFGVSLGLDRLLLAWEPRSELTPVPGRMSPSAAAAFLAIAVATPLVASTRAGLALAGQWLAALLLLVGLHGLIGYALKIDELYRFEAFTALAPHAAFAILLLAIALLYSSPRVGVGALLVDETMTGTLARRLLPVVILPPMLLGALAVRGAERGWIGPQGAALLISVLSLIVISTLLARSLRESHIAETQRDAARSQLQVSESMFRESFESAFVGMAHLGPDLGWIRFNDRLAALLQRSRAELRRGALLDFIVPDVRRWVERSLLELFRGERESFEGRIQMALPSSGLLQMEVSASLAHGGAGTPVHLIVVFQDVTAARYSAEQLRLTERAMNAVASGIVITDARLDDNPIVYVNPEFERITGYSRVDAVGRNCRFLNEKEPDQPALAELREALDAGRDVTVVLRNFRKDGTLFWNELTISAVTDEDGRITHFVGIQDDITTRMEDAGERERLLAEALESRQSAESASRAREMLLAVVSHELRSPLNAIRLWASLLESTPNVDAATLRRALEQILSSVDAQSQLIADLLDATRFQSGRVELEKESMDWAALVGRTCVNLGPAAKEKGVALRYKGPSEGLVVYADPRRLEQVVRNLVENSLKFTPAGGSIDVELTHSAGRATLVVRDDGDGIEVDALGHLFDQFWQADSRDTRRHGGLGLGLNIVKHVAELHDGSVSAHSQGLGHGAEFVVELPLSRAAEPRAEAPQLRTEPDAIAAHLLVVDDDAATAEALGLALRIRGHDVRVVGNVNAALEAVAERRPRAIISDLMMPGRTGFDFLREIRFAELERNLPRTPAIAISGRGGPEDKRRVLLCGFDEYLQKPVRVDVLHSLVETVLSAREHQIGLKVLAVVGDRSRGESLRDDLIAQGHEVYVAATSAEALLLAAESPDVLVMEGTLGDSQPDAVAARLRGDSGALSAILVDANGGESTSDAFDIVVPDRARLCQQLAIMRPG